MSPGSHATLHGFGLGGVHHVVEQIRFAMLAPEIPADNVIVIGKMCFALLASEDLVGCEIDVIFEPHDGVDAPRGVDS